MTELRAIGYVRISKEEQHKDPDAAGRKQAGPEAQRERITRECIRQDWQLIRWCEDIGVSGGTHWPKRPGAREAIEAIERGEADILVCSKLDRLSRSLLDFADILDRSQRKGWRLSLLDFGMDTSKPTGRMVAHIIAAVAEFERQRIGERTKEALAEKRRQGVRIGRPRSTPQSTVDLIRRLREDGGLLFREVACQLNERGIPTAQGGALWRAETVRSVYRNLQRDEAMSDGLASAAL